MNSEHTWEQLPFDRLVQRYLDGQVTPDEMETLNLHLSSNAAARQSLIEFLNLDSALAATLVDWSADVVPETVAVSLVPRTVPAAARARGRLVAAVACLAALLWAPFWMLSPSGFATVQSGDAESRLANGAVLRGDWYELEAGTVELRTVRGARIVIEAPARFRYETAQRLHLTRGRLAADIPPAAKGFTVITPTGQAIDLGTKFGVDVPLVGETEIHVFQGEVVAQTRDGRQPARSLIGGEALQLQATAGSARALHSARSAAFIQPDEVASLHAALTAGQPVRAQAALARLRHDPALIALLDFEEADLPQGEYRMVQGRWPGSRAPEFASVGDHMLLDVGGDRAWPQLTLAAWVRLDRLGEPYQSLLHTDGWNDSNPGQVHWMVTQQTTMRLALFGNTLGPGADERFGFPDSRTSVLPEQGRWVHLAAVYDAEQHTVRFYLNGEFDKETPQALAHPARLGPAQIGNWNRQDRKLSGRVDELLLLGRALTDAEIRELFAAGNPYR